MNKLTCDLQLGGSTKQLIVYNLRNKVPSYHLADMLIYKAKTKPAKTMRRAASLVGLVYDKFNGDEEALNYVIDAILLAEKYLNAPKEINIHE